MTALLVPNHVRDVLNSKLDAAIAKCPEAAVDREFFYQQLLEYFDEFGDVPEVNIEPRHDL